MLCLLGEVFDGAEVAVERGLLGLADSWASEVVRPTPLVEPGAEPGDVLHVASGSGVGVAVLNDRGGEVSGSHHAVPDELLKLLEGGLTCILLRPVLPRLV
ncbi:hypothetical protein C1N75_07590 [Curtobacterium sp. SGAir0571]